MLEDEKVILAVDLAIRKLIYGLFTIFIYIILGYILLSYISKCYEKKQDLNAC